MASICVLELSNRSDFCRNFRASTNFHIVKFTIVAGYWLSHNDLKSCTAFIVFGSWTRYSICLWWLLKFSTRTESHLSYANVSFGANIHGARKKRKRDSTFNPGKTNDEQSLPNKQTAHFVCMQSRMNLLASQLVSMGLCLGANKTKLEFQQCLQMKYIFRLQLQVINYKMYAIEAKLSRWYLVDELQ